MLEVVIPWRDLGCPYRKKSFSYIYEYYSSKFNVSISDSNHDKFNRSAARNSGVLKSNAEIIAIIDADTLIPHEQLYSAIKLCKDSDKFIQPFSEVRYLDPKSTNKILSNKTFEDNDFYYLQEMSTTLTGGAFIVNKDHWIDFGGMDERFLGWGFETDEFYYRAKDKDKIESVDGYALHLYHPSKKRASEEDIKKILKDLKKYDHLIP